MHNKSFSVQSYRGLTSNYRKFWQNHFHECKDFEIKNENDVHTGVKQSITDFLPAFSLPVDLDG